MRFTRRDVLERCVGAGVLSLAGSDVLGLWLEQEAALDPTTRVEMGPFFRRGAPVQRELVPAGTPGLPLGVSGQVLDVQGRPLAGARVEIWHADHAGVYDLAGFRCRGALEADEKGGYGFDSVMPGHYPARVGQHVHYLVQAPGLRPFSTQLYFATDPAFEGDPRRHYTRDPLIPDPALIRPVLLEQGEDGKVRARVRFDLVIGA